MPPGVSDIRLFEEGVAAGPGDNEDDGGAEVVPLDVDVDTSIGGGIDREARLGLEEDGGASVPNVPSSANARALPASIN